MTLNPPLSASLKAVGTIMGAARDPWWIIASGAVALHGADPGHVADVDVLLSVDDATRIPPAIGIEIQRGSANATFRSSILGVWTGTALPVDFMADFHSRSGTEWVPVRPSTRQTIALDGVMLFAPERDDLQAMLCAFGRPKDIERARRLSSLK